MADHKSINNAEVIAAIVIGLTIGVMLIVTIAYYTVRQVNASPDEECKPLLSTATRDIARKPSSTSTRYDGVDDDDQDRPVPQHISKEDNILTGDEFANASTQARTSDDTALPQLSPVTVTNRSRLPLPVSIPASTLAHQSDDPTSAKTPGIGLQLDGTHALDAIDHNSIESAHLGTSLFGSCIPQQGLVKAMKAKLNTTEPADKGKSTHNTSTGSNVQCPSFNKNPYYHTLYTVTDAADDAVDPSIYDTKLGDYRVTAPGAFPISAEGHSQATKSKVSSAQYKRRMTNPSKRQRQTSENKSANNATQSRKDASAVMAGADRPAAAAPSCNQRSVTSTQQRHSSAPSNSNAESQVAHRSLKGHRKRNSRKRSKSDAQAKFANGTKKDVAPVG